MELLGHVLCSHRVHSIFYYLIPSHLNDPVIIYYTYVSEVSDFLIISQTVYSSSTF
jgi:sporulation protein YlmC with PRC-barrel domain